MAEFILRDLTERTGVGYAFEIASAATSAEEIGNPVYPPARRKLMEHGIDPAGKRARQLRREDYNSYDWIIGMDGANMRNMRRLFGGDPEGKLKLLMDFTGCPRDVADPWYTDDFETAWRDIDAGCRALFACLQRKEEKGE